MGLLEVFTSLLVIFSLAVYFVKRKYSYWKDMGVPYAEPEFPYGNLKGSGKKFHFSEVMRRAYNKLKSNDVPFCGLYFFLSPVVLVTSLDFVKTVLVKNAANFIDRGSYYNEKDDPLSVSKHTCSFNRLDLQHVFNVGTFIQP
jgi:cytochrome P450 family 6